MPSQNSRYEKEVNGRWIYTGTFFLEGEHGKPLQELRPVRLRHPEREYLAYIALTMLSAPGGDFDEDDTVYADIYTIDGRRTSTGGMRGINPPSHHGGGVWGRHFGNAGDDSNEGISSYVGRIDQELVFRIFIDGDDWVGASYFIMELAT